MLRVLRSTARHVARALLYGFVGGFVVVIAVLVVQLNGRPDLHVWHKAELDAEFVAGSTVTNFAEYLELEGRLFQQLDDLVYEKIDPHQRHEINRYNRGSLSDPNSRRRNWNHSFELSVESPRVGVLLLHGMSDSPYSLRRIGQRLHHEGAWVVGLRIPGHGTAPSGLLKVEWQDMAAAVRIAMRHLREKVGDRPVMIVGYSNGGALAVEHALQAIRDDTLPIPDRIVLLSPEIGISKFAALAVWQERLGHVLGLEKLAWNSINPEYDPYKYGSFALNAGKQAWEITQEIQTRVYELRESGKLADFPPTLAFQSVADATVSAPALVTGLFDPLASPQHELVLFDINRATEIEPILKHDPQTWLESVLHRDVAPFTVNIITNVGEKDWSVISRKRRGGQNAVVERELGLSWPSDLYSLTHVSLPFAPDDPVYGGDPRGSKGDLQLGNLALRGERGVLAISASEMLRLRWNPFYSYVEDRIVQVVAELE